MKFNQAAKILGGMSKSDSEGLISGRPILQAEGQFVACHFSPSEYVPFRKIGRRELKEILRRAADKQDNYETHKNTSRKDEFEMISLSDSGTVVESCLKHVTSKTTIHEEDEKQHPKQHRHQHQQEQQQQQQQQTEQGQKQRFSELLQWISQEGEEFVHIESFSDLKDVFTLLDVVGKSPNPVLTTILIRENEPSLVNVSLSNVKVDVQCSLFCMFQASAEGWNNFSNL